MKDPTHPAGGPDRARRTAHNRRSTSSLPHEGMRAESVQAGLFADTSRSLYSTGGFVAPRRVQAAIEDRALRKPPPPARGQHHRSERRPAIHHGNLAQYALPLAYAALCQVVLLGWSLAAQARRSSSVGRIARMLGVRVP